MRTAASLVAASIFVGCAAATSYEGISLKPGAAAPDLQQLAARARAGNKQAQLDLGIRFEEGRGVPRDLQRAIILYQLAARSSGGTRMVYIPASSKHGRAMTVPLNTGVEVPGLAEASRRLIVLQTNMSNLATPGEKIDLVAGEGEADVLLKSSDEDATRPCEAMKAKMRAQQGIEITLCEAYAFMPIGKANLPSRVYDLVVTVRIDEARRAEFPTTLVDPAEPALVDAERPVAGHLSFETLSWAGATYVVVKSFRTIVRIND